MVNDEWQTPPKLFKRLDDIFYFTLDPCTTADNPLKTPKFFTREENGLIQSWRGEIVYINPPYSRGNIDKWTMKAYVEGVAFPETIVVALLPLRTAKWFRRTILPSIRILKNLEDWKDLEFRQCGVFFLEKRVRFIVPETGKPYKGSPTFDSIIVIWR